MIITNRINDYFSFGDGLKTFHVRGKTGLGRTEIKCLRIIEDKISILKILPINLGKP
jgi:hypothetical protein